MRAKPIIALAGNPNVGKTSLFNALTGARQTVGNWPGVTVEHKSGICKFHDRQIEVIDLPGIYSLSGGSPDEQVARSYILSEKPDLIINIVDASNLERNLYLTVQLMELGAPLLLLLSMNDIAEANGISIDTSHLALHLGFSVLPLVMNKQMDLAVLTASIEHSLNNPVTPQCIHYDEVVEQHLDNILRLTADAGIQHKEKLETSQSKRAQAEEVYSALLQNRWMAVKLIEGDAEYSSKLNAEQKEAVAKEIMAISKHRGQEPAAVIADDRYGFIRGLVKDVVKRRRISQWTFSDAVDKVVLSGFIGLPIFFGVMYLVFLVAVKASEPLISLISGSLTWLFVDKLGALLTLLSFPKWLNYLLSDALGGGIATIGSFVPPIFFIYVSLSILEDSGYMARAAFIADKFMRRIGLPGKAFIPLLVGFGCTVPAIMATRTLESPRDRVFASILTPFVSCGAKLPVYTFLGILFFPKRADLVIFGLYMFGIVMGMLTGLMLKKAVFKSEPGNFVMELPPYHMPTFNAIMLHTWHRLKDFILRAGKTILLVIVIISVLQVVSVPVGKNNEPVSLLELGGKAVTPLLTPMGIKSSNWQASVALLSGLFAKEAIVGTMQSLYQKGETVEKDENNTPAYARNIKASFGSSASAIAFLVFVLLYSPCAAALTMLFREHGFKWMLFSFVYLTALAWMVATLIYQTLAFNSSSIYWIASCLGFFVLIYVNLRSIGRKHVEQS
ncbi:MAG: ferrous iron transport protein B [Candidatus Cloacimonetes bacterium]|nr:ferrous iron transport protein B [Candidatus Cloacimonadota bacterium]